MTSIDDVNLSTPDCQIPNKAAKKGFPQPLFCLATKSDRSIEPLPAQSSSALGNT